MVMPDQTGYTFRTSVFIMKQKLYLHIYMYTHILTRRFINNRYYADTGDIDGTLAQLPKNRGQEKYVLKALKRLGKTEVHKTDIIREIFHIICDFSMAVIMLL